jgi:4-amino-4-deoxychorismate lyase
MTTTSAPPQDFGLIETLLWTRDEGYHLLAEHLARLGASSRSLGFPFDEASVLTALNDALSAPDSDRLRVRLVLNRDGSVDAGVTPIEAVPQGVVWKVALAKRRFSSDDLLLRHKTTRREIYEGELAEAQARIGADEVLFRNERDEICEGARCNVFLARNGVLLTPPLDCGLLPGTLRAHLLATGRARESILRLEDFRADAEFYMGNSVRGLVRGEMVATDRASCVAANIPLRR